MTDLLIRDLPADIVEAYRSQGAANGKTLEAYVRDVLEGRAPVIPAEQASQSELVALTLKNLQRFKQPLAALPRRDFREGLEE